MGPARQRSPGRLNGVRRVRLAGTPAGLAVGAVDFDYLYVRPAQEAGQAGTVRAGALDADAGHEAETVEPAEKLGMPGTGGGELGHAQQPADGVYRGRHVHV